MSEEFAELSDDIAEIKKWVKIQGLETLGRILDNFSDEDLVIYENTDGDKTQEEIAEAAGVGSSTVGRRHQEWLDLGIVEKEGRKYSNIAPLAALGLEEPELEEE